METRIGNIPGDFGDVDLTCPRCNSSQVIIQADNRGYFEVTECHKCGYKRLV